MPHTLLFSLYPSSDPLSKKMTSSQRDSSAPEDQPWPPVADRLRQCSTPSDKSAFLNAIIRDVRENTEAYTFDSAVVTEPDELKAYATFLWPDFNYGGDDQLLYRMSLATSLLVCMERMRKPDLSTPLRTAFSSQATALGASST